MSHIIYCTKPRLHGNVNEIIKVNELKEHYGNRQVLKKDIA